MSAQQPTFASYLRRLVWGWSKPVGTTEPIVINYHEDTVCDDDTDDPAEMGYEVIRHHDVPFVNREVMKGRGWTSRDIDIMESGGKVN